MASSQTVQVIRQDGTTIKRSFPKFGAPEIFEAHGVRVEIWPSGNVNVRTKGDVKKLPSLPVPVVQPPKPIRKKAGGLQQVELRKILEETQFGDPLGNGLVLLGVDKQKDVWGILPQNEPDKYNKTEAQVHLATLKKRHSWGAVHLQSPDICCFPLINENYNKGSLLGTFPRGRYHMENEILSDGDPRLKKTRVFVIGKGVDYVQSSEKLPLRLVCKLGKLQP